jgi:hypothetical protein
MEDNEMGSICGMRGKGENAFRILVRKTEGKRQLGSIKRLEMDNIKWI